MELEFLKLLQMYGPSVAVIFYFLYRDFKREHRFMSQIEELDRYQKDVLESLVEKSTIALTQSTECLKWVGRILERWLPPLNRNDE